MRSPAKKTVTGFTVLDVTAALVIVAILAVLFVPSFGDYLNRAREVSCLARMRAITVALHGYLHDHQDVWPQGPRPTEESAWEAFWLATLKPYGIADKDWRCPSITALLAAQGVASRDMPALHYQPAMFPPTPGIATRYATQPWLIERADAHGRGALIAFPGGEVKSAQRILAELGGR